MGAGNVTIVKGGDANIGTTPEGREALLCGVGHPPSIARAVEAGRTAGQASYPEYQTIDATEPKQAEQVTRPAVSDPYSTSPIGPTLRPMGK